MCDVANGLGRTKVIETTQHVVMPIRREPESLERFGIAGLAIANRFSRRKPTEQLRLEQIFLPSEPSRANIRTTGGSFEDQESLEDLDCRIKRTSG
jgi:hypothetical protein